MLAPRAVPPFFPRRLHQERRRHASLSELARRGLRTECAADKPRPRFAHFRETRAESVSCESWLRLLWIWLNSYLERGTLEGWMLRICRHRALDHQSVGHLGGEIAGCDRGAAHVDVDQRAGHCRHWPAEAAVKECLGGEQLHPFVFGVAHQRDEFRDRLVDSGSGQLAALPLLHGSAGRVAAEALQEAAMGVSRRAREAAPVLWALPARRNR